MAIDSTGRLFLDASNLRRVVDEAAAPPCPGCRRPDWSFEPVPGEDLDDFVEGPWGFAYWSPGPPAAPHSPRRRLILAVAAGALCVIGAAALALNPDPFAAPGKGRPQIQLPAGR